MEKTKKFLLVAAFVIAIIIGTIGFVAGPAAIANMSRNRTYKEPPTFEEVQEELEYWLVSNKIHVERKEKVEDYIIYYVQDYQRGFRYYAVVYKVKGGNYLSYHWEYSHHVTINGDEYAGK